MPESALTAPKDKKLTGRQWFESGRASAVILFSFLLHTSLKHREMLQKTLVLNKELVVILHSLSLDGTKKIILTSI